MKKKFKIKLEDKAAFINRLEKFGVNVDTFNIQDNKLDGTFTIELDVPEEITLAKKVISKSKGIDQVKSNIKEVENPRDVIKMDVPLFIRLLEYAREDAKTDMDLHDVSENIISLSTEGRVLSMADYNKIMIKKMQENFNPDDYEWEEEYDPKILRVKGKMDQNSYIDCDILTINGEETELRFHVVPDSVEEGYAVCEADDGDIIYTMDCNVSYWGMDGYRIYDIDEESLDYHVNN
jgi:hypothetical protein